MKFSEAWVREWVDPPLDTQQLCAQLTMAGLEVDGAQPVAGAFTQVVVAEIQSTRPHPKADRLQICQVATATTGEPLQIVCGAPNARAGMRAPLAMVGARLPGDIRIEKAKLRGIESQGMLCSRAEIGVAGDSTGLWELPPEAPLGQPLVDFLQGDDQIIGLDLTPNRADALSIRGIAREIAVLNQIPLREPTIQPVPATSDARLAVDIQAAADCPLYCGRIIEGVDAQAATPLWMARRLERSEVGPVSALVDITNYVLLELGQPLHAFDRDQIQGDIAVRHALDGESLELLDGSRPKLNADSLLIADHRGPLALAGIMGGAATAVTAETRNIFLESAFFSPAALAGQARTYGLHTDASHRYERGVDYELPAQALERATALISEICGGQPGPLIAAGDPQQVPHNPPVRLRKARLERLLGVPFTAAQVTDILERLGMQISEQHPDSWTVVAPSWRFDIRIEADLIEEVARIHSYAKIPERTPPAAHPMPAAPESRLPPQRLADQLVARGFREAINYSFIAPDLHRLCVGTETPAIRLQNPIAADMALMRTALLPGLLQTVQYNLRRQRGPLRLFESGLCFVPQEDAEQGTDATVENLAQIERIAAMLTGDRWPESWANESQPLDFYDAKREVELLLAASRAQATFAAQRDHPLFHPGQCASVSKQGTAIGTVGAIHPRVTQALDIDQPVYAFELDLPPLLDAKLPHFQALSRFPEVRRDLALLVADQVPAAELLAAVQDAGGVLLCEARLFDLYAGPGIDRGKKSVGLSEQEIAAQTEQILSTLADQFGAVQR